METFYFVGTRLEKAGTLIQVGRLQSYTSTACPTCCLHAASVSRHALEALVLYVLRSMVPAERIQCNNASASAASLFETPSLAPGHHIHAQHWLMIRGSLVQRATLANK